jgi:hypothetical protein
MKLNLSLLGWACVIWLAAPARGGEPPGAGTADPVLTQEIKQQQIKSTTKKVGDQLEGIIAEFDRNGIAGEDVKVLRAIRSVIDRLSEQDMQKVIGFLQQARAATDAAASAKQATEAYAGQKMIIVQLQQLVLEYQRQQALYEISLRLKELASRQSANMWLGVGLAKSTEGKSGFSAFDENQKISLRYQQSEQTPLREETAGILKKLERLAQEIQDGVAAERPRAAVQQAREGGLLPALDAASGELREDNLKLLSAIGSEKRARDQMREIARLLILSQNPADALRQAIQELDHAMDVQKGVKGETAKTRRRDEADKRATDQAAVVDDTDLIRKDIDSLAPVASEHLRNATDKMQEARAALSSNDDPRARVEKATPRQDEALTQMQQARRALEEQLALAEEQEKKPENALAELKDLLEEVRDLIKKQDALKQETAAADVQGLLSKAPKQGELKDKSQEAQTRAANKSPEAASSLSEAASQMQRSQNSLAGQQNNPAAQQAAIDSLQKAEQQLAQDIARLEQAEKDLAQLEDLLKRLVAIIEAQQQVHTSTAKLGLASQPEPEPVKALGITQSELSQQTSQLQQEAGQPAPRAAEYLGTANGHMKAAKAQLDKAAPKTAEASQAQALRDLYLAKQELEKRIEELQEMLGQPSGPSADALAEAQRRIREAQRQVNEALSQLQQAPPGLMETLQKQQQEIAKALDQLRQDTPESAPVSQAHQAADRAAQELSQSDLPRAIDAMKQARKGMEQASQSASNGQPQSKNGDSPSLSALSAQQAEVQKAAESLMSAQQNAPASAMQAAADALQSADGTISPLTAGKLGRLPSGAQSALQSAQGSLNQGTAQASAGQNTPAQMSATDAADSLAQAQAALALAQAGLGSQPGPGQGQASSQGQGKTPGQGQGQGQGQGLPPPQGTGNQGNWNGAGGADGQRAGTMGGGTFTRLPNRDRAALQQSQSEKYPQEYGPLVEQYLKNLSDQAGEK